MWEVVERLLKERNMRIKDLSRETGVSYSSLTDWKAGRSKPKIDKIMKIAAFFGVSAGFIMNGKEDGADFLKPDERALLAAFAKLNTVGRLEAIKRILEMTEVSRFTEDTPSRTGTGM